MPAEGLDAVKETILPLNIRDVSYAAGGRRLVEAITTTIPQGGLTAVIGPNGAGKSLFLRLCHGLLVPQSGAVVWQQPGGRIAGTKRHAMVFQQPVMLRRSVLANLVHPLRASGLPRQQAEHRAAAALERFGFGAVRAMPARLMSGGEKQRLAIARAWAMSPDLIFLDEPTSQLDPGATRQIETMLRDLLAEGVTLVMATHDLGQARRLASRVLCLFRGRLIEDAAAPAFFERPSTAEARAFLAGELVW